MHIRLVKKRMGVFILFTLGIILHFSNLSGLSIYALDEAKNATAALEMWQKGEWVVPTFNGAYRFDKPPLHYYFFAMGYQIFGVNEFAARFFPALFGCFTLLITFLFAKRHLGYRPALLTLLVLTASPHWFVQFHMAVPDPFLIFFMTAGLYLFYEWKLHHFQSWSHMLGFYISLALAVLSKGPIGMALPVLAILIFSITYSTKTFSLWRKILHPGGLFAFFALVLPWFILVAIKTDGLWLEEFIFKHNLGRFSSPMEGHGGGFWLTLIFVFAGLLPFGVFLPQAITHTVKYRTNKSINFAFIAALVVIVFFMLSRTKLPNYTVPAYPFLALLIGHFLESQLRKKNRKPLLVPMVFYSLILLAFPFAIYFGLKADPFLSGTMQVAKYFIFPVLALPLLFYFWSKDKILPSFYSFAGGFILLSLLFFYGAFPKIDKQNPVTTSPIQELKNGELYYYKIYNPSFSFYLQKPIKDITKTTNIQQVEGYLITRKKYLKDLKQIPVNYQLLFEGKDLFESPTSVIVKLTP